MLWNEILPLGLKGYADCRFVICGEPTVSAWPIFLQPSIYTPYPVSNISCPDLSLLCFKDSLLSLAIAVVCTFFGTHKGHMLQSGTPCSQGDLYFIKGSSTGMPYFHITVWVDSYPITSLSRPNLCVYRLTHNTVNPTYCIQLASINFHLPRKLKPWRHV